MQAQSEASLAAQIQTPPLCFSETPGFHGNQASPCPRPLGLKHWCGFCSQTAWKQERRTDSRELLSSTVVSRPYKHTLAFVSQTMYPAGTPQRPARIFVLPHCSVMVGAGRGVVRVTHRGGACRGAEPRVGEGRRARWRPVRDSPWVPSGLRRRRGGGPARTACWSSHPRPRRPPPPRPPPRRRASISGHHVRL